jgi:4-hydroxybenzoate polyprenyltransferase
MRNFIGYTFLVLLIAVLAMMFVANPFWFVVCMAWTVFAIRYIKTSESKDK